MNKTTLTALVAAAFALSIGANATFADQSQPTAPTPPAIGAPAHGGHGHHGRHLIKELGLTKDQIAQIKTIRTNFKTQADTIKNDSTLNEADKKGKLKALRQDMKAQVSAVLTPEQREKLKQLREEHREARDNAGATHDNDAD